MPTDDTFPPFEWFQRTNTTVNHSIVSQEWRDALSKAYDLLQIGPDVKGKPLLCDACGQPIRMGQVFVKSGKDITHDECIMGSGEPQIPSVKWDLTPIDELFLKTMKIQP